MGSRLVRLMQALSLLIVPSVCLVPFCFALASRPAMAQIASDRTQWEYRMFFVGFPRPGSSEHNQEIVDRLNRIGENGWEIFQVQETKFLDERIQVAWTKRRVK